MKVKKKPCDGPCNEDKYIWANKDGKKYCRQCWYTVFPLPDNISKKKKAIIYKVGASSNNKSKAKNYEYLIRRKEYLLIHPSCEAKIVSNCSMEATEIHHKAGRLGSLLVDDTNFLAVCRNCHQFIELNPKIAKELGFSTNRL